MLLLLLGLQVVGLLHCVASQSVTYYVRSGSAPVACGQNIPEACSTVSDVIARVVSNVPAGYNVTIDIGSGTFPICDLNISSLNYLGSISFFSSFGAILTDDTACNVGIRGVLNTNLQVLTFSGLVFFNFSHQLLSLNAKGFVFSNCNVTRVRNSSSSNLIEVNASYMNFSGCTIRDCATSGFVIQSLSSSSQLVLSRTSFLLNSGTSIGSAVSSRVTIQDSMFADNSASKCGAMSISSSATVQINRSNFIRNYATSLTTGIGGGICISSNVNVVFANCQLIDNYAYAGGGAIHIGDNSIVGFSSTNFSGNVLKPYQNTTFSSSYTSTSYDQNGSLVTASHTSTSTYSMTGNGHNVYASSGTTMSFQNCTFKVVEDANSCSLYKYFLDGVFQSQYCYTSALFLYSTGGQVKFESSVFSNITLTPYSSSTILNLQVQNLSFLDFRVSFTSTSSFYPSLISASGWNYLSTTVPQASITNSTFSNMAFSIGYFSYYQLSLENTTFENITTPSTVFNSWSYFESFVQNCTFKSLDVGSVFSISSSYDYRYSKMSKVTLRDSRFEKLQLGLRTLYLSASKIDFLDNSFSYMAFSQKVAGYVLNMIYIGFEMSNVNNSCVFSGNKFYSLSSLGTQVQSPTTVYFYLNGQCPLSSVIFKKNSFSYLTNISAIGLQDNSNPYCYNNWNSYSQYGYLCSATPQTQLVVQNCSFSSFFGINNFAFRVTSCGIVSISNSSFTSFQFTSGDSSSSGGAVRLSNVKTAYLTGNVFESLQSDGNAGALSLQSWKDVLIKECSFKDLEASRGAVAFIGSRVSTSGTVLFDSNIVKSVSGYEGSTFFVSSSGLQVKNSTFSNCYSDQRGSVAIVTGYQSSVLFLNSTFLHNSGGEMSQGGVVFLDFQTDLTVDNCTFIQNYAYEGGVVYAADSFVGGDISTPGTTIIRNSRFYNNTADVRGGVFAGIRKLIVAGSVFSQNQARLSSVFQTCGGGAIFLSKSVLEANSSQFSNNFASQGGSILLSSDSGRCYGTVSTSLFEKNSANVQGGSITCVSGCNLNIKDTSFRYESANVDGGALFISSGSTVNIINTSAVSCSAGGYNGTQGRGGVAFVEEGALLELSFSLFKSNVALSGGAFYLKSKPVSITSSEFSFNSAIGYFDCLSYKGSGGAILADYFISSCPVFGFSDISFTHNDANGFGGAVGVREDCNCTEQALILPSCRFDSNRASYGNDVGSPFSFGSFQAPTSFFKEDGFTGLLFLVDSFGQELHSGLQTCVLEFSLDNYSPIGKLLILKDPLSSFNYTITYPLEMKFTFTYSPGLSFPDQSDIFPISININPFRSKVWIQQLMNVSLCRNGARLISSPLYYYSCDNCLVGKFLNQSSSNGVFVCAPCPAGKTSQVASTSCDLCAAGKYSFQSGSPLCGPCAPGTYASDLGTTVCSGCPRGTYQGQWNATMCHRCPVNATTLNEYTASIQGCVCAEGSYGNPVQSIGCKPCPSTEGVYCLPNSTVPLISRGLWRYPEKPDVILQCIYAGACVAYGSSDNQSICEVGYTGHICGDCLPGQYFQSDALCVKCSNMGAIWPLYALCFIVFMIVVFRSSEPQTERSPTLELRIAAIWMQFMALYPKLSFSWPPVLTSVFRLTQILNFDTKAFSPGK
jgi:hypothetical protein